jgi:thioredoxin 1
MTEVGMAGSAVTVTDESFQAEVLDAPMPVVVDFWAEWCGPCKMLAPTLEELAVEYSGRVKVAKMNVDESQGVPQQFQIRSIPTLLFFKKGELVKQLIGAVPKAKLSGELDELLKD